MDGAPKAIRSLSTPILSSLALKLAMKAALAVPSNGDWSLRMIRDEEVLEAQRTAFWRR
jgi:hypothetical protein